MNGAAAAWVPEGFAPAVQGGFPPQQHMAAGVGGAGVPQFMPHGPGYHQPNPYGVPPMQMQMQGNPYGAAGMMPMDPTMDMGGPPEWHHHHGSMDGGEGPEEWPRDQEPAALSGRIVDLAFSKTGSMALQADLVSTLVDERTGVLTTVTNTEHVAKILQELEGVMDKVMQDRYGSHLARALVKVCSVQQRIDMWRSLQGPTLIGTACSHFGKWVVQRMIESAAAESANAAAMAGQPGAEDAAAMSREEMATLQQALCNNHTDGVLSLCFDPNGSTVMKACVVSMPVSAKSLSGSSAGKSTPPHRTRLTPRVCFVCLLAQPTERQFVYDAAAGAVVRLAKDKYGCGTLHRCLEAGDDSQKLQLAMAVGRNARPMATDAHGNYILQNVMAMDRLQPKEAAVESLSGSFVALAKHKFGSNVVEKCVSAGEWALQAVMGEIFLVKNGVEELLGDRYGNFVMQAIIKKCKVDGELLHSLRSRITDYERVHAGWSESLVGVRILQKLNKRLRSARALELREAAANEQEQQVAQLLDDGEGEPEPEPEPKLQWQTEAGWQSMRDQSAAFTAQMEQQWRGTDGPPGRNNVHAHGRSGVNGREHGAGPGRRQRTPAQQQKQKERQQQRMQEQQAQRAKRQHEQFQQQQQQQQHFPQYGQQPPNQMQMQQMQMAPPQGEFPPGQAPVPFNPNAHYPQTPGVNPNNMPQLPPGQLLDPQQQAQMLHQQHILEQQMAMQQQQMQMQQAQMAAQQAQMAQMQAQMQGPVQQQPLQPQGDAQPQSPGPEQSPSQSPADQDQGQQPPAVPQPMSPTRISPQTVPGQAAQVVEQPVAQRPQSPQSPAHHDSPPQPTSPVASAATNPPAAHPPAVASAAPAPAPSPAEQPGSPTLKSPRSPTHSPDQTSVEAAAMAAAVPDVVPTADAAAGAAPTAATDRTAAEPVRKTSRMPFGNQNEPSLAAEVDTLTAALDSGVLRAFLASQGLEKFESVLADNEVRNLETLCMLQEEDLSELGMLKGPRVKMLRTMKAWQAEQNSGV
jgi:hypothetical protein